MNTADRSIALLDTALRRRFVFEEMMPDASHPGVSTDADGVDCRRLLAAMNRRIAVLLDREHQIGHTYFLGVRQLLALASTFRTRIIPLLQEYFYDDWEKIRAVLNNNGFVRMSTPPEELVRSDLVDADRAVYDLLPADERRWDRPDCVPCDLRDEGIDRGRRHDAGRVTMPTPRVLVVREYERLTGLREDETA